MRNPPESTPNPLVLRVLTLVNFGRGGKVGWTAYIFLFQHLATDNRHFLPSRIHHIFRHQY